MFVLDLYKNTLARELLDEASVELNRLRSNSQAFTLARNDLLQMIRNLKDELFESNSIATLTKFNIDRQNQSILVQRHLGARITNEFYEELTPHTDIIWNTLKRTTLENIVKDYEKINAARVDLTRRWEKARQEQMQLRVEGDVGRLQAEVDRLNKSINQVQLSRQKIRAFHNNRATKLKHQTNVRKSTIGKEIDELRAEILENESLLQRRIEEEIEIRDTIRSRQEHIDKFNARNQSQDVEEEVLES